MPNPNVLRTLGPVQVEIKVAWADAWVVRPNVIPMNASIAAGGVGQFQFRVPYGFLKHPLEGSIANHDYTQIAREWVRVKSFPYTDADIIFQGRIESDSRELFGPDTGTPSGMQVFTAYDGVSILAKRRLSETVFRETGTTNYFKHDSLIPFNRHPRARELRPNRADSVRATGGINHYVFEQDKNYWRGVDTINYLLAEFLNGGGNSAVEPQWSLVIPAHAFFQRDLEPFDVPTNSSVLDLINLVFGRRLGVGWAVVPVATGFELRIFTLTGSAVTYESATIPANPNSVTFNTSDPDASIHIERTFVDSYASLRVISRPLVVVRSFDFAANVISNGWEPGDAVAFGAATAESQQSGDWPNVFQEFRASLATTHWVAAQLPTITAAGALDTATRGPIPQLDASTLQAVPLSVAYDYITPVGAPPIDQLPGLPPRMWMKDGAGKFDDVTQFAGASLYTLPTHIGLIARVQNPGLFTLNDAEEPNTVDATYDPATTVMTLAFEACERLQFDFAIGGAKDSDGIWIVEVPEAEVWYLAPDTALTTDGAGALVKTAAPLELRNDRELCFRVMAGCIVRYINSRSRATVRLHGLWMYGQSLGYILSTVADATDANTIAAPITAVQWQFEGDYMTSVSTGFAI